jgi:hypothetical protein
MWLAKTLIGSQDPATPICFGLRLLWSLGPKYNLFKPESVGGPRRPSDC